MLKPSSRLFFEKDFGEANLELAAKLGQRLSEVLEDFNRTVTRLRVVLLGLAFQDWPIPPIEILEHDTDRVARLSDANSLQHTRTPQLLQHVVAVEVRRRELVVRLDAADVPWR